MMADIEDPPASRARGILLGLGFGIPIVLVIGLWFLPVLHAKLIGGAQQFDDRLRQEDAYMHALCNDFLEVERDEDLCSCALGAEYPSLDCRTPFMRWSIERMNERCSEDAVREGAVSFCTCVDTLTQMQSETADPKEERQIVQRYQNCAELPDAIYLPALEELAPPAQAS
jgi:hypothetical protein